MARSDLLWLDSGHVEQALASGHTDFEDELQIARASTHPGITVIITRNLADYSHGSIPAMSADEWLRQYPNHRDEIPSA
jgi:hypothetical protein